MRVINALEINFDQVYLWSDSQITLAWIKTEPHKLKVFIANRVSEIQDLTSSYQWNHVPTLDNPADLITRGLMPQELSNHSLWWDGPLFLYDNFTSIKSTVIPQSFDREVFELKKEECTTLLATENCNDLIDRYSSYTKLLRMAAYCLRFKHNAENKDSRYSGSVSIDEINNALIHLVKFVQAQEFSVEISALSKHRELPRKSPILSLNPFLDHLGVLRVGGRLQNPELSYDTKHQMLIPSKGHFTDMIFRHYHSENFHAGPQLLVSLIREKFWPIASKNAAKRCVRLCLKCFRFKPKICTQIMGSLPVERTTRSPSFDITGIDFCGPFLMKTSTLRKSPSCKVYIAVFVCFVTKGVHLELVTDLTSEKFIGCLKRFIYRRGHPSTIYSDNGKTFVGANNELKKLYSLFQDELIFNNINAFCESRQICWKFIPPRAPNFGGLWESCVKSVKTHLKKVAANRSFTFEEFYTLLVGIEGILNSRPLTAISNDPSDPKPITPAHILIGKPIAAPSEPSLTNTNSNHLTVWRLITQLQQSFWNRFSTEHIHELQQRVKWKTTGHDLQENDIVLVVDENLPSTQWLLGRIIKVTRGPDDRVRVAEIRTKNGIFTRSLQKICKFPTDELSPKN